MQLNDKKPLGLKTLVIRFEGVDCSGHASFCECKNEFTYSPEVGLCLTGYAYQVKLLGALRSKSTDRADGKVDFMIDTQQGPYDLILSETMTDLVLDERARVVEVEGETIVVHGLETPLRRAIIVERLRVVAP